MTFHSGGSDTFSDNFFFLNVSLRYKLKFQACINCFEECIYHFENMKDGFEKCYSDRKKKL